MFWVIESDETEGVKKILLLLLLLLVIKLRSSEGAGLAGYGTRLTLVTVIEGQYCTVRLDETMRLGYRTSWKNLLSKEP